MRTFLGLTLAALLAGVPLAWSPSAHAAGEITCRMSFRLSGWSAFYKRADGAGNVVCSNGARMTVHLRSRGGGLTFGKSSIEGLGKFSGIFNIDEILGTYATGGAHAGVAKSAGATVMTKGNVSLAMSGTGKGWDIGIDFGKLTVSRE